MRIYPEIVSLSQYLEHGLVRRHKDSCSLAESRVCLCVCMYVCTHIVTLVSLIFLHSDIYFKLFFIFLAFIWIVAFHCLYTQAFINMY